jgi:hypothetical protein
MMNLCSFLILLAIGYYFIDKKTQTELINKCKKNKFIIIGGIIFVYYFFLRNNIEGITVNQYNQNQKMRNDFTAFSSQFCWADKEERDFGKPISGSSPPPKGWPIKGGGSPCHIKMMSQAQQGVLLEALDYEPTREEKFKPKILPE